MAGTPDISNHLAAPFGSMGSQIATSGDKVVQETGIYISTIWGNFDTARHMFARSLKINPDQPELNMLVDRPQDAMEFRPDMPGAIPQLPSSTPVLPDIVPSLPQAPVPQLPFVPEP